MEVVWRKLSRKTHCKDASSQLSSSFRKSVESSSGRERDVGACRKTAAWAWHHRAGGDAVPTRASVETIKVAAGRNSKFVRPKSRFRTEAMIEKDCDSASKSKSDSETNLYDAAELSSMVKQIAHYAKTLQEGSLRGGVDTLNQRTPASDGLSKSCRFHQHKSDENEFGALPYRSFSSLSGPRHSDRTPSKLEVERDCHDSKFREDEMDGRKQTNLFVAEGVSCASSKMPFPLIQRLFRKISKRKDCSHSTISEQTHNHHHYHHHHHFYYYPSHTPSKELQDLGEAKVRRHSQNFRVHTERKLADQESRRMRRHSGSDFVETYRGFTVRAEAAEVLHLRHHEDLQPFPEHYLSNARLSRRHSESINVSQKTQGSSQHESGRMRRHSTEIDPSHLLDWSAVEVVAGRTE